MPETYRNIRNGKRTVIHRKPKPLHDWVEYPDYEGIFSGSSQLLTTDLERWIREDVERGILETVTGSESYSKSPQSSNGGKAD